MFSIWTSLEFCCEELNIELHKITAAAVRV